MSGRDVLKPSRENGKSITCSSTARGVAIIVWKKNNSVLLPLDLTRDDARELIEMLRAALSAFPEAAK